MHSASKGGDHLRPRAFLAVVDRLGLEWHSRALGATTNPPHPDGHRPIGRDVRQGGADACSETRSSTASARTPANATATRRGCSPSPDHTSSASRSRVTSSRCQRSPNSLTRTSSHTSHPPSSATSPAPTNNEQIIRDERAALGLPRASWLRRRVPLRCAGCATLIRAHRRVRLSEPTRARFPRKGGRPRAAVECSRHRGSRCLRCRLPGLRCVHP
jgi:hypothetical protein